MKKILAMVLAAAMVMSLAACSTPATSQAPAATEAPAAQAAAEAAPAAAEAAPAEAAPAAEKVFRYASTTEPTSLDPSMGNSIEENELQYAMQEGLTRTVNGEVQPGLADSWEVDETGTVYTFHIRDDAKWSDGQEIKAQDFEYSWKRLANPETGSGYAWILSFVKGADAAMYEGAPLDDMGIKAIDDDHVEITLAYVAPYFLSLVGSCGQFAPIRQDIVEQYGTDFAATAEKNIYSGPFKLVSSENLVYVFEKNEYYWNQDAVKFDRVEHSIVADANTQLAMYESGDLDYVLIPTAQTQNYVADPRHGEFVNGNTDWMYINNEAGALANKNLRLAINYAIDREAYNLLANNGVYQPFNGVVCNIVAGKDGKHFSELYSENRIFPTTANAEKAQEYLAKAMEELGVTDPSQIEIELTSTDAESTKKICEVVQNLLQTSLGIKINIRQVTYGEIYSKVFPQHDYEMGYGGWGPDYDDPFTYLELFYGPNPNNYSNYKNPEVDALLEDAKVNPDVDARMADLGKAEKLILEDGAILPLQMRTAHYLLDEDVKNITFSFVGINIGWAFGDIQ